MKFRRYQLRKDAVAILERGHPWLFREQMSTAAQVFGDGDWLRLVDGANRVVGHGIYESDGAIAIRMLRRGAEAPDAAFFRTQLAAAIERRRDLATRTTGLRLLHGESDGIPAVVADRFADTLVVSSYSGGADALARYLARLAGTLSDSAPVNVILRPARRRQGPVQPARVLRGAMPDVVRFVEEGTEFAVDLAMGHKTGTYLDLRGLRRHVRGMDLGGQRVLNLFAYSGMLGRCAERAGASEIVQVDQSQRALDFAAAHHVDDASKHRFVAADVFSWLPNQPAGEWDVVICDPPAMTSRRAQVPGVLAAYRKMYRAAARIVKPGGLVVAACCTSRVERSEFHRTVRAALGEGFRRELDVPPEPDHPVGFPQADYLKIELWRAPGA